MILFMITVASVYLNHGNVMGTNSDPITVINQRVLFYQMPPCKLVRCYISHDRRHVLMSPSMFRLAERKQYKRAFLFEHIHCISPTETRTSALNKWLGESRSAKVIVICTHVSCYGNKWNILHLFHITMCKKMSHVIR